MRKRVLLVNFGGPRSLSEVPEFLRELLTDGDVIRTPLPKFLQDILFKRVAKTRAVKIAEDYEQIGGRSPIYEDTEWISSALKDRGYEVLTFHRYLPATHEKFLEKADDFITEDTVVLPLFPQFSFATTGSIARWMKEHLCCRKNKRLRWIKSYSEHPSFVGCFIKAIKEFLEEKSLKEEETLLFYSPHGLPLSYVREGDVYQKECESSYFHINKAFPKAGSVIGYQSQFGRSEWIRPYTNELADTIGNWNTKHPHVVFIPLSFTSDHIETLFEVEKQYVEAVKKAGFQGYRCPAFNRREDWINALVRIIADSDLLSTEMLIRKG